MQEERASFSKRILVQEQAPADADGAADDAANGASNNKKSKPTAYDKAVAEGYAAGDKLIGEDEANAGLVDVFRAKHPGGLQTASASGNEHGVVLHT